MTSSGCTVALALTAPPMCQRRVLGGAMPCLPSRTAPGQNCGEWGYQRCPTSPTFAVIVGYLLPVAGGAGPHAGRAAGVEAGPHGVRSIRHIGGRSRERAEAGTLRRPAADAPWAPDPERLTKQVNLIGHSGTMNRAGRKGGRS